MITLKGFELQGILQGLIKLSQAEIKLKAKFVHTMFKAIREIQSELKLIGDVRMKLIGDFSENGEPNLDKENNKYIVNDEEGLDIAFSEILNQDIEINVDKVFIKIPEDVEIVPIALQALMALAENEDIFIDEKPNIVVVG